MTTADEAGRHFEYEVALSFAGEDRATAARLADELASAGVTVFYDQFREAAIWGKNLYDYLASVYYEKSQFCIMILSKAYVSKGWPNHERQHAQARALSSSREYILPLRLDDVEVPGLAGTVGYIDLREHDLGEVVDLILHKIKKSDTGNHNAGVSFAPLPDALAELPDIVTEPYRNKQEAWEYSLFVNALRRELDAARNLKADLEYGLSTGQVRHLDFSEYRDWHSGNSAVAVKMASALSRLVNAGFQRAIGEPGEAGDPVEIYLVAKKIGEIYRWALEWAAAFHSVVVDDDVERLMRLHSEAPLPITKAIERICCELQESLSSWLLYPSDERPRPYICKIDIALEYPNRDEIEVETRKLERCAS